MRDDARRMVERLLAQGIDDALRVEADNGAAARALKRLLDEEAQRPWNARVRDGIKYADLLQELYAARKHRKLFSQYDGISARGQAVLDAVSQAPEHGLKPSDYRLARAQQVGQALAAKASADAQWRPVMLAPEDAQAIVDWLGQHKLDPSSPQAMSALIAALAGPDPLSSPEDQAQLLPSPLPRITAQVQTFREALAKSAPLGAQHELLLADAALRFARDMKHFNLVHFQWREMKDAGGSKKIIYDRLAGFFQELAATPVERLDEVFKGLEPPHPDYLSLIDLRNRYAEIKRLGGWPQVSPVGLARGKRGAAIAQLRRRLMLGGYLDRASITLRPAQDDDPARPALTIERLMKAPLPDVVDDALLDAVARYRRNNQLATEGPPDAIFWRSLNVPVERRLEQVELNIHRWRESRYGGESDYVFVNLPDFHAEIYRGHKLELRFRVVIGKNNRVCDPKTSRWAYPNATPQLKSQLEYFILNPSWFVPERIVQEEIMPYMEQEGWLAARSYEVVERKKDKIPVVRQNPGPDNALGLVKFIFPNKHNTYMHDTPKKKYFEQEIRAFSHGCMRVHEPLKLAKYLAQSDGQAEVDIDALLKTGVSKQVRLKQQLPVFVEYYTVSMDEQGAPRFLMDIYYLDRRQMSGNPDGYERCTPAPAPAGSASGGDDIGP